MDLVMSRVSQVSHRNWGKECSLCSSRHGVPIECSARGCKAAYHTTCAIRAKLKMQAIFGKNYKGGIKLRSYCKEHAPAVSSTTNPEHQDKLSLNGAHEIDMTNMADDRLQENSEQLDYFWKYVDLSLVMKHVLKTSKGISPGKNASTSSKAKQESNGESPSPNKSSKKLKTEQNSSPSKKDSIEGDTAMEQLMIDLIYRYWILLRTSNQGQSLIKFSPLALREREIEQRKSILKLRIELERIRNLTYMIGKREKIKLAWLKTHNTIVRRALGVVDELIPTIDRVAETSPSGKKSHSISHQCLPLIDGEKLVDDLVGCDMIYPINDDQSHISPADCPSERRRTLSLVRRINQNLKSIRVQSTGPNPYAKNYPRPIKRESPISPRKS